MCNNIDNNRLIYKCILRPKAALVTVGTLLFGFNFCDLLNKNKYNQDRIDASKSHKVSHLPDSPHMLKAVRGLKQDQYIGLIAYDKPNQSTVTGSKKMGLLFYAPKPLTDCVAIHLSNQKMSLTYGDPTNPTILNNFIEVDGPLLKQLLKKTEPLRNGHHSLKATCSKSFTIFHSTDYGICVKRGTKGSSVRLAAKDKDKVKALTKIEHAGFVLTKSTTPSVNGLVELIKYLLLERESESKIKICPAEIARNRLQPSKNPLGDAAYGYIKQGSRYRLMLLSRSTCSVTQPKEVIVTITNDTKKAHRTADIAVQTDNSLLIGNGNSDDEGIGDCRSSHSQNNDAEDDIVVQKNNSTSIEESSSDDEDVVDSGFSDGQDHHASSMTSRTNSIESNIFDNNEKETYSHELESNRSHSGYDSQDNDTDYEWEGSFFDDWDSSFDVNGNLIRDTERKEDERWDDAWDSSFDHSELIGDRERKEDEWDSRSIVSNTDSIECNMFDDEPDEKEERNHDDKADDHNKDNDSSEQKEDYNDQLIPLNPEHINFKGKYYCIYPAPEEQEFKKNSLDSSKEQPKSKTKTIND